MAWSSWSPTITPAAARSTSDHRAPRASPGRAAPTPEKALVFCVDEKSQIQALQRSQPGLPMKPGRMGTMTHDYKRHGTTTLFAALNVLEGTVIGSCLSRHRHQEFRKFLNLLDAQTPRDVAVHAIVDNYATHKHPAIQRWLRRHPRFHLHFVPTSASWLNLVEVWFSHLTTDQLQRGDFLSVPDLIDAIYARIFTTTIRPPCRSSGPLRQNASWRRS